LPRELPKIVCKRRTKEGTVQEDLHGEWALSQLGDVLLRGFPPGALLACNTIGIVQQVELPKGWAQESARLVCDISPAAKELHSVPSDCGEKPVLQQASNLADPGWKRASTTAGSRTNVRAAASTEAKVVAHLPPNAAVLVRKGSGDWWRVKASTGGGLEGYVREDRLVFR
jgi:hypothetical protein